MFHAMLLFFGLTSPYFYPGDCVFTLKSDYTELWEKEKYIYLKIYEIGKESYRVSYYNIEVTSVLGYPKNIQDFDKDLISYVDSDYTRIDCEKAKQMILNERK